MNASLPPVSMEAKPPRRWSLDLPRRFLLLPPAAFLLGFTIGCSRGGSKARLRFLAENSHRQPTTIQGWYFYTKTRNYRMLFGGAKQGAKDGLLLGAATSLYVMTEEGVSKARHGLQMLRETKGKGKERAIAPTLVGEEIVDKMQWLDDGIAGTVSGLVISLIYKFPYRLLLRTTVMGLILGAVEGGLRIAQSRIGQLRDEERAEKERLKLEACLDTPMEDVGLAEKELGLQRKEGGSIV